MEDIQKKKELTGKFIWLLNQVSLKDQIIANFVVKNVSHTHIIGTDMTKNIC